MATIAKMMMCDAWALQHQAGCSQRKAAPIKKTLQDGEPLLLILRTLHIFCALNADDYYGLVSKKSRVSMVVMQASQTPYDWFSCK